MNDAPEAAGAGDPRRHRRVPHAGPRRSARGRTAATAVLVVLVLAGLFFAGTRLPGILNPTAGSAAAGSSPTETATPTPTPTAPVPTSTAGPQLAGTFEWFQLRGGECITPFISAWQQRFTVVDCATPHGAQVVSTGTLGADPAIPYPGQGVIAENLNLLCQQAGSFNRLILTAYPDVVWQAGYPVTTAQWQAAERNYYCFVSRSSSLPLTGDFAGAPSTG